MHRLEGVQSACQSWDRLRNRRLFLVLAAIALVYAFLAGLRTVNDYDLGWQLATGRWVARHHQIFSTDVFSYTAQGQPWIYPVLSGLVFYAAFQVGGWTLLSWLGALACVVAVAVLLRRGSAATAALAIVAIPRIAARTAPRAELFTTVLFAIFLSILWEHLQTRRVWLWLLPVLMIAWVNLHPGFVAGLALIAAYVGTELLGMIFAGESRRAIADGLRHAWPWLLATVIAPVANPWGLNILAVLVRQQRAMAAHSQWISEWASVPLNWSALSNEFSLRETQGTFLILLGITVITVVLALLQRQLGVALLLAGGAYLGASHVRLQALFACIVVVVGGSVISSAWQDFPVKDQRWRSIVTYGAAALLALLAIVRCADLISDRHYLGRTETSTFGTGLSWWFPEKAFAFITANSVPGPIFHDYNVGGFLIWRLGDNYRDFVDGRAIPFGPQIFETQQELLRTPPDSPAWERLVARYGIETVALSLSRFDGDVNSLPAFCASRNWSPIYLDEVSALFVRRTTENEALLRHFSVDCMTAPLPANRPGTQRNLAFPRWANAALILHVLGRYNEAWAASNRAMQLFPDSANLHFIRAQILIALGDPKDAEQEYRIALDLEANDMTWAALAKLYRLQGRNEESLAAMRRAVKISSRPHQMLVNLAFLYLQDQQPTKTLEALEEAVQRAPAGARSNRLFQLDVVRGRAAAWLALNHPERAILSEEQAAQLAPDRPDIWEELAALYERQGRLQDAQRARNMAANSERQPQ